MHKPIPESRRRDALIALERYFIRARLMQRDYHRSCNALARRALHQAPKDPLVGPALEQDSYFYLWIGCLRVVAEGFRDRLRCSDSAVDALLSSHINELFAAFRNVVFHFDPEYDRAAFHYLGEENFEWPNQLMDAFTAFFRRELGDESLVDALDDAAA